MNYLDLFSGICGFALGADWAGMHFEKHYFSEVDPYCCELYAKRFPDAIALGDIKEIDCEALADTKRKHCDDGGPNTGTICRRRSESTDVSGGDWIITGGFPCQDISTAGKGAGIRGRKSGLWFEMRRIIGELRPRFVIIENVAALTSRGLNVVLADLATLGMDAEWQDIRAEDVGAPHRRERIWIVAYPGGMGQRRQDRATGGVPDKDGQLAQPIRRSFEQHGVGGNGEGGAEVADTSSERWRPNELSRGDWTTEPDVC